MISYEQRAGPQQAIEPSSCPTTATIAQTGVDTSADALIATLARIVRRIASTPPDRSASVAVGAEHDGCTPRPRQAKRGEAKS